MTTAVQETACEPYDWKLWPRRNPGRVWVRSALEGNAFAARLAERMAAETSTRFVDWVDHLVVTDRAGSGVRVWTLGYRAQDRAYAVGAPVYAHRGGMFPRVAVSRRGPEVREVAIKVESVAAFSRAHDLGLDVGATRSGRTGSGGVAGEATSLAVVERRGYLGFEPFPGDLAREGRMRPHAARDALAARELWQARRRRFDDDAEGFDATEATLERMIELAGLADLACHLVFEVERDYWQSRNRAARVQKARQDRLGLGWANHDHHTFRCSRRFFPRVIAMFESLGFHAPRAVPRRGARRLGRPDPRAPDDRHRDLRRPRPRARRGRRTTSPTRRSPTCPGRTRSGSGSACTASRSSRPGCTTWRPSSISTPSATVSRPRPASRR